MQLKFRKRYVLAGLIIGLLVWQRNALACSLVRNDGNAVGPAILQAAEDRIARTYGVPRARPRIVDGRSALIRWVFKANTYASTVTIPTQSCIVIAPKGQSVDILAHEMVHAEIAHRVGYWAYLTRLPKWFDEGTAMQVDDRAAYDLPNSAKNLARARHLPATSAFFRGDDAALTRRYALAKLRVADWLRRSGGPKQLYRNLDRVRQGGALLDP